METTQQDQQFHAAASEAYNHAANLFINHKKNYQEVVDSLIAQGVDYESAAIITGHVEQQVNKAKSDRAKKDMLYGALWCIGGTVLTLAHIGFIFWGAIVFGAIQFFKEVANL